MCDVAVVGSINVDLSLQVPHEPRRGETLLGASLQRAGGGKGANQAVGCARLGRSVAMVGAVGDDADGRYMLDLLTAEGVDVAAVRRVDEATGQAVICVEPDGESTIVVAPGANWVYSTEDLEVARDVVSSARCVLVQQEIAGDVVARASELATGMFVLNPAPSRPISPEVLARVDVLVPNRHELTSLCGAPRTDDRHVLGALARGLAGPAAVVITMGEGGALVVENGQTVHVPAVRVDAVDATAAGDTFCAALVDGLLDGMSCVEATQWAVRAAALATVRRGAMGSIPHRNEIDAVH